MNFNKSEKAYLILENGTVFEGKNFGAKGTVIGEAVFTTSMTGYQETLTDSVYTGQLIIQTFPLIGNYGTNDEDYICAETGTGGYIVREYCEEPSNFRCSDTIDGFLKKHEIIGLYDIDTRRLTRILREQGTMNAMLTTESDKLNTAANEITMHRLEKPVSRISVKSAEKYSVENPVYEIAVIDYGYRKSLYREFNKFGCNVTVYPYNTTAEELEKSGCNGVVLSGGPGNPEEYKTEAEEVKKLLDKKIPVFGIGLGHQLMAIVKGGTVRKLKYGHRGSSQPVINLENGRTYITAQNHGYIVETDNLNGIVTHINGNDKTCEGIKYKDCPALSVQFYPVTSGGINGTTYLFGEFVALMKKHYS